MTGLPDFDHAASDHAASDLPASDLPDCGLAAAPGPTGLAPGTPPLPRHPADALILALDRPDAASALALAAAIPDLRWVKVGLELFSAAGPDVVSRLRERGLRVFLDLKFHDIPATMAGACRSAARLGAELITVHACAGTEALVAAQAGAEGGALAAGLSAPTLLAVTVLTIWDPQRFARELAIEEALQDYVPRLARLSAAAGIGGCVCSPLEVAALRAAQPAPFALVTPGIRPAGAERGDQQRVLTPAQAMAAGASQLVIGRPISAAADPAAAFAACCQDLTSTQALA
ncbi:MAG: orotidine-5'-phosphate decarboxylase [Cyanobacteria bacterium]|nr:orotidine-5'-phosphate decarboxylase [Cyanobacteriota bacterium]